MEKKKERILNINNDPDIREKPKVISTVNVSKKTPGPQFGVFRIVFTLENPPPDLLLSDGTIYFSNWNRTSSGINHNQPVITGQQDYFVDDARYEGDVAYLGGSIDVGQDFVCGIAQGTYYKVDVYVVEESVKTLAGNQVDVVIDSLYC